MPQSMRIPERRTESVPMEVEQIFLLYNVLSSPSIKDRNLQDLAIETFWPDMNILQAETLLHGLFYLDSIELKDNKNDELAQA